MKLLENSEENLSKSEEQYYLAGILPYNQAIYHFRQAYLHECPMQKSSTGSSTWSAIKLSQKGF